MKLLLIATNNPGKMREIQALLQGLELELVTPGQIGIKLEVAEVGATYAENAAAKGVAYARAAQLITLADDSGLEVDALGGCPACILPVSSPDQARRTPTAAGPCWNI